jgi:hypothetical protein
MTAPVVTAIGRRIRPDGVRKMIKGPIVKGTIKKP